MPYVVFAVDRGTFFGLLIAGLVGLAVLYFLFLVVRSIVTVIYDIKTNWELDSLAGEFSQKRKETAAAEAQRLDNGCVHSFEDQGGALPANVCSKCGMERTKPIGECDHVWRVVPGIVPQSQCERCGATFCTVHEA